MATANLDNFIRFDALLEAALEDEVVCASGGWGTDDLDLGAAVRR
jgi:hypothetical protein